MNPARPSPAAPSGQHALALALDDPRLLAGLPAESPHVPSRPAPLAATAPAARAGSRAPWPQGRRALLEVLLALPLALALLAGVLEGAPFLRAWHGVRTAAAAGADLAAANPAEAASAALRFMETRPSPAASMAVHRLPGSVEVTVIQDYAPSAPLLRALLPPAIRLEATERRPMAP